MGWEESKQTLKERYLPLNYTTSKMNEFLSSVRRGRIVDVCYEEFVKLSRHASLITEEQKLSRFIIGLEGQLAEEVNALRPVSLADALIREKAKLLSFSVGDRKRANPYPPSGLQKINPLPRPMNNPMPLAFGVPRPYPQQVKINALPINQSGRPFMCYKC